MQPDTGDIGDRSEAPAPKIRLVCLEDLDGRRTASRRAYELIAAFEADLGGKPSAVDMLSIRRAAMLCALAEHEASRQMAGEATDIDQVVRLSNAARRAVADLNLPKRDKRNEGPTLADYAAAQPAGEIDEEAMDRVSKIRELFKRARETPTPSLVARAKEVRELLETASRRRDAKHAGRTRKRD